MRSLRHLPREGSNRRIKKSRQEREKNEAEIVRYMGTITHQLPYFIDNNIMYSFDVTWEYKGKLYNFYMKEIKKKELNKRKWWFSKFTFSKHII